MFLNHELDTEDNDLIRSKLSKRGGRNACYIRKSLSYNHKQSICRNTEIIFIDIFLPKSIPIFLGVLCQPSDKPDVIEHPIII